MTSNLDSGVIVVNKPQGITSHDVVSKIRKLYQTKQVGHTGTLDPLATGVLPVLVGRAVKASDYLLSEEKVYLAGLRLGLETDTEDITGKVVNSSTSIPTEDEVKKVALSFIGDSFQVPPMYSAIKVNGQKLVDLARRGVEVERTPRPITIKTIEIEKISETDYKLRVVCSKGTYIRTLCSDIGKKLGCFATMLSLEREKTGPFDLSVSHTLEELETLEMSERLSLLIPIEEYFSNYYRVDLEDFYHKLSRNGAEIYLKKIGLDLPLDSMVRLYNKNEFYAIGIVKEFPDGMAIKTEKLFKL